MVVLQFGQMAELAGQLEANQLVASQKDLTVGPTHLIDCLVVVRLSGASGASSPPTWCLLVLSCVISRTRRIGCACGGG